MVYFLWQYYVNGVYFLLQHYVSGFVQDCSYSIVLSHQCNSLTFIPDWRQHSPQGSRNTGESHSPCGKDREMGCQGRIWRYRQVRRWLNSSTVPLHKPNGRQIGLFNAAPWQLWLMPVYWQAVVWLTLWYNMCVSIHPYKPHDKICGKGKNCITRTCLNIIPYVDMSLFL